MAFFQIFVLAVVQGITEFLPISSSGHLILSRWAFDWPDPGPNFDVAVHVGTLAAVMVYFHRDVARLGLGGLDLLRGQRTSGRARLSLGIAVATLPVMIIGLILVKLDLVSVLHSPAVIAWATIIFAIPLYLCDRYAAKTKGAGDLRLRDYLFLGLAQGLAVIPGTSRSGITMTAGRYLQLNRSDATQISMLMALPSIAMIGAYAILDLSLSNDLALGLDAAIGAGLAFGCAWAAIWGLMAWVKRASFTPFVIYRLILGAGLLFWIYF